VIQLRIPVDSLISVGRATYVTKDYGRTEYYFLF
jgi:hypothetical protein